MNMRRDSKSNDIRDILGNGKLPARQKRSKKREEKQGSAPPPDKSEVRSLPTYLLVNSPLIVPKGIRDLRKLCIQLGMRNKVRVWTIDNAKESSVVQEAQLLSFVNEIRKHVKLKSWASIGEFFTQLFQQWLELEEAFPHVRNVGFHPAYLKKILMNNSAEFVARATTVQQVVELVKAPVSDREAMLQKAGREAYDNWPDSISAVPPAILALLEEHLVIYPLVTGPTLKAVASRLRPSGTTDLVVTEFIKNVFQ
jgi:hypothetical protein